MRRALSARFSPAKSASAVTHGGVIRLAPMLAALLAWQGGAAMVGSPLLPTPLAVLRALADETLHGSLPIHLAATLGRVAICFTLAMIAGTIIGLAMASRPEVNRWLDPWLQFLLNIPAMVVAILAYLWLGLGEPAAILAITLSKLPNVAVILREGGRQRDRDLAEMVSLFRFPWRFRVLHLAIPELAPYFLAATRSGLSLVWKIVLLVELLGRSTGIGFQLQVYFQLLDVTRILAYSASFMAVILLIEYGLLTWLDRRIAAWRR